MLDVLQPDTLLERFAARKANNIGHNKDFLAIKGTKGQLENAGHKKVETENELIGFKCIHYSVTESSGSVEVTIVKKTSNQEVTFGIRTVDNTAKGGGEFEATDEIITMKKRESERTVVIKIFDNNEWQPDLDFSCELYDPNAEGMARFYGDDTTCKITILDEDFPGTLGFEITDIQASKS